MSSAQGPKVRSFPNAIGAKHVNGNSSLPKAVADPLRRGSLEFELSFLQDGAETFGPINNSTHIDQDVRILARSHLRSSLFPPMKSDHMSAN